jgi:anti-anti-sigma regulatory factor
MQNEIPPLLLEELPEIQVIRKLAEQFSAALAENAPIALDGHQADSFDGFNLQLVLALASAARRDGIEPDWRGSSPQLRKAAAILGFHVETMALLETEDQAF